MSYRILAWDGARVLELYERTDRDEAMRLYRATTQPAAFAEGATVLQANARGRSHAKAFEAFASKGVTASKPRIPDLRPSEAPPPRKPASDAWICVDEPKREELPEAPASPEPTPALETPPVKLAKKTKLVRKAPTSPAPGACERCNDRPAARVTVRTKPGTETWCTPCRGSAGKAAKAKRRGGKASKPAKAPKRKPASKASPLADVLVRVKRDRVVVDELGGIDAAERFVDIVRNAGGPDAVFAFFDEVSP